MVPVSSINTADTHRLTRSSAYTSGVFSETRYALNGELRVAYRASREGPRDIVFVPTWFTCCEVLPELPSIQGWVEAMTSLGRLIFFDQPGTGASDPVTAGALPTLELWADSITAVLDDLGSREAVLVAGVGAFATGRYSPRHIRLAQPRSWPSRSMRIRWLNELMGSFPRKSSLPWSAYGARGRSNMCSIRTCRGMRRSGQRGLGWNVWRPAQEPLLS